MAHPVEWLLICSFINEHNQNWQAQTISYKEKNKQNASVSMETVLSSTTLKFKTPSKLETPENNQEFPNCNYNLSGHSCATSWWETHDYL